MQNITCERVGAETYDGGRGESGEGCYPNTEALQWPTKSLSATSAGGSFSANFDSFVAATVAVAFADTQGNQRKVATASVRNSVGGARYREKQHS